jgi:fibronectin-binding autotransporter adhesin
MVNPPPATRSTLPTRRILVTGIASILLGHLLAPSTALAINLNAANYANYFDPIDAVPSANDWRTLQTATGIALPGTDASATFGNAAQITARVNSLTATEITDSFPVQTTTNPPSLNLAARFNAALGTGGAFQTRPTGNSGTPMMALIKNDTTDTAFTNLEISFDYRQIKPVATETGGEQVNGWMAYFSVTGQPNTWVPIPEFSQIGSIDTTIRLSASLPTSGWNPGVFAYLLFFDDNAATTADIAPTLDNFNLKATLGTTVPTLLYNASHTVGGSPSGVWEVSNAPYWLATGNAPSGFTDGSKVVFNLSQDATISVPADVHPSTTTVSNPFGTLTIGGPGKVYGSLVVNGGGTLSLETANAFTSVSLSGGETVITKQMNALGTAGLTLAGNATLQTDEDLVLGGGISGVAGARLTKTGTKTLSLTGAGDSVGGITLSAGRIKATSAAALGGATQSITAGPNTSLEIATDGAYAGSLAVGTGPFTFVTTNVNPAQALTLNRVGGLTGTGPITKEGVGVLRMSGAQAGLSSPWTINGGSLEGDSAANPFGSGSITVNTGGTVSLKEITITNSITLNGGTLGVRTGDLGNYAGTVNVATDSFIGLRSSSTPTGSKSVTISGLLSGSAGLTVAGNVPLSTTDVRYFILTNPGNTYSGKVTVTSLQNLRLASSTGTGTTLGTGSVTLAGGGLVVLDNGLGDNGTITYPNAITVDAPTSATLPGSNTITVDRFSGVAVGNTIEFPNVTFEGARTLATASTSSYRVKYASVTLHGDATFQVDTAPLEISGPITGAFSIHKTGTGELLLSGNSNFTGPAEIVTGTARLTGTLATPRIDVGTAGLLDVTATGLTVGAGQTVSGTGTVSGVVTLTNGGSLTAGDANGAGTLNVTNLTLGTGAADTSAIRFDLTHGNFGNVTVTATDGLVINSGSQTVSLSLIGPSTSIGTYTLLDYTGTPLANLDAFKLVKSSRIGATLVNDTFDTRIAINVTLMDFPIWTGAKDSAWTTATIADPKNWKLSSTGGTTDFLPLDNVVFDSSATNRTINLMEDVTPSSVTFDHSGAYSLEGNFSIVGATGLTKRGDGTLTINAINAFTGPVVLEAGTVEISTMNDGGQINPLGKGTVINFAGGTLSYTGGPASTNRVLNTTTGPGTIQIANSLTLTAALSGAMPLTKSGPGTLALTADSTAFIGGLIVRQGVVEVPVTATSYNVLGGNSQAITLDGGTLRDSVATTADAVFSDAAAILRTLTVGVGGGTLNVATAMHPMVIRGGVSGQAGATLTKSGAGILRIYGVNPELHSDWVLNEGILDVEATSLGSGNITVNGGSLSPRNVTINNNVTVNGGVLGGRSGDLVGYAGTITAAGPFAVDLRSTNSFGSLIITISGQLNGNADISITGPNPQTTGAAVKYLALTNVGNTYSGTFKVQPSQVLAIAPATLGNPLATAVVELNGGALAFRDNGVGNNGFITYGNNVRAVGLFPSTVDVNSLTAGGSFGNTFVLGNLEVGAQTFASRGASGSHLKFNGGTTLTGQPTFSTLKIAPVAGEPDLPAGDLILSGPVSGSFGFVKTGDSRLILENNSNVFTGPVDVQAGTLLLRNANIPAGNAVTVGAATLAGSGSLGGDVLFTSIAGSLSPGETTTAVLSVSGNLTLVAGMSMLVDLDGGPSGPIPGTTYDHVSVGTGGQLSSTGAIQLSDANLLIRKGASVADGNLFFLLLNDGADAVVGGFAGLIEGQEFTVDGQGWRISYHADSVNGLAGTFSGGNDVALLAVPEPGSALLLLGGLGALVASRRRRQAGS